MRAQARRGDGDDSIVDADGDASVAMVAVDADRLLDVLHTVTRICREVDDLDVVFDRCIESVCAALEWSVAIVHLVEDGELVARSSWEAHEHEEVRLFRRACEQSRALPTTSLLGAPLEEGQTVSIVDVDGEARFVEEWGTEMGLLRWIGVPIGTDDEIFGVVTLATWSPAVVDQRLLTALEDVGTVLGHAVERNRHRRRLGEVDEAHGLFVSRAAHALRDPLGTLGIAATTLAERRDRLTPAQQDQLLDQVEHNTDRLRDVLVRLFQLVELESGDRPVAIEPVPIAPIVDSIVAALPAPFDRSVEVRGDDVVVMADVVAVDQILSTLLANAVCHGGSSISVTTTGGAGFVQIAIGDDGPGLPAEIISTLFQPFSRGRDADREGFGFGLALSRQLARACGGDLFHKAPTAQGTYFILTLPGG